MKKKEMVSYLGDKGKARGLFVRAENVRKGSCGDAVLVRGIIEFSNHCVRNCLYCGLRRDNKKLKRFRMTERQILNTASRIVKSGITTVILQSGDDFGCKTEA